MGHTAALYVSAPRWGADTGVEDLDLRSGGLVNFSVFLVEGTLTCVPSSLLTRLQTCELLLAQTDFNYFFQFLLIVGVVMHCVHTHLVAARRRCGGAFRTCLEHAFNMFNIYTCHHDVHHVKVYLLSLFSFSF